MGCNLWMEQNPIRLTFGGDLLEHLQPFSDHGENRRMVKPVTLPPGRAMLTIKPLADWIDDIVEDNRDAARRLFQRRNDLCAAADNEVRRRTHQFRRVWLGFGWRSPAENRCSI